MSTEDGWTDDRWIERKGQRKAGKKGEKRTKKVEVAKIKREREKGKTGRQTFG